MVLVLNYRWPVNTAISGFVVREETLSLSQLLFCVEAESESTCIYRGGQDASGCVMLKDIVLLLEL